jgi:SAM-dependent methyltransferase
MLSWAPDVLDPSVAGACDGGVLRCSNGQDFYWGEVERAIVLEALSVAEQHGWVAGAAFLGRQKDFLYQYLADCRRADFALLMPSGDGTTIWDCGCGFGAVAVAFAKLGSRVIASDPTLERIRFTTLRAKQERLGDLVLAMHLTRIDDAPIREGVLEGVVVNGVLEYVPEMTPLPNPRSAQVEVLAFLRSRLKPHGRLYLGIENRWGYSYFLGQKDHGGIWGTNIVPRWLANYIVRRRTGREYRTWTYSVFGTIQLLRAAGFSEVEPFVTFPSYRHFEQIFPWSDKHSFVHGLLTTKGRLSAKRRTLAAAAQRLPAFWRLLRFFTPELGYVATR